MKKLCLILVAAAAALFSSALLADNYPSKPVTLVAVFGPGSASDTITRVVAQPLGVALKQSVIVEARPGANGAISAMYVARAPADGYTLLMTTNSPHSAAPFLMKNIAYDPVKDFTPVSRLGSFTLMLVVHPSIPAKSVKELIELARSKPDQLSFGSSGVATGTHLSGELFKVMTGVKMVHVPYPGSPQAVTDLLAGRIQVFFSPASTVLAHVREGKLVALASTEAKRTAAAPELPTMAEAGLPGFDTGLWFGLLAPSGTPGEVIDKLARAANAALESDEVVKALAPQGIDLVGGSPADFARYIDSEMKRWATVAQAAGLKKP